jgi:hypothetical protein
MPPTQLIKEEAEKLHKEVRERSLGYIMTALGLVAGLAWNEAIRSAISIIFPADKDSLLAQFTYAVLITIVIVVVITYLNRYLRKES